MPSCRSRNLTFHGALTAAAVVVLGAGGCARLGFTDRVLLRAPSPDGTMVAVCQEVPGFDGPGYTLRLESPDGTLVRRLYVTGDGDPCSEIAWAADGGTLAVLTAHVARVKFVDVEWALKNPDVETAGWSWREISFSAEGQRVRGRRLHFTEKTAVALELCPSSRGRAETGACPESAVREVSIPQPIVSGHPARAAGR